MKYIGCKGKLLSVLLNSKEQFIFQIEKNRVSKQCNRRRPQYPWENREKKIIVHKVIMETLEWNKFESYW